MILTAAERALLDRGLAREEIRWDDPAAYRLALAGFLETHPLTVELLLLTPLGRVLAVALANTPTCPHCKETR